MLSHPQRRGPESNRCAGLCRPLPKPLGHPAVERTVYRAVRTRLLGSPGLAAYAHLAVELLERCPECSSTELRTTTRQEVEIQVCSVCDWSSDPSKGRPPADRSKNFTLRRLVADADNEKAPTTKSDQPS
jgi:Transcription factor zinc-finger